MPVHLYIMQRCDRVTAWQSERRGSWAGVACRRGESRATTALVYIIYNSVDSFLLALPCKYDIGSPTMVIIVLSITLQACFIHTL